MIYSFFRFKIPKISPSFHCGMLLLICCTSIAQNKPDLVPTSVSEDFRAGHENILYIENAIHQVKIIYYFYNDYVLLLFLNNRTNKIFFIINDKLVEGWKKVPFSQIVERFSC